MLNMEIEQTIYFHDKDGKIRIKDSDLKDEIHFYFEKNELKTRRIQEIPKDSVEEITFGIKKIKLTESEKAKMLDKYVLNKLTGRMILRKL
jgi:hypothetical protein